jgi:hypothetical protein
MIRLSPPLPPSVKRSSVWYWNGTPGAATAVAALSTPGRASSD